MKPRPLVIVAALLAATCALLVTWTRVDTGRSTLAGGVDAGPRTASASGTDALQKGLAAPSATASSAGARSSDLPAAGSERATIGPSRGGSGGPPVDVGAGGGARQAPIPITFTVVDADTQQPIEGATVTTRDARDVVRSDEHGVVRFTARGPERLRWTVSAPERCPVGWILKRSEIPRDGELGELPMVRERWIEGRVVDCAGEPVASAAVDCAPEERLPYAASLPPEWTGGLPRGLVYPALPRELVLAAPDGTFRVPVAPCANTHAVSVTQNGFLPRRDVRVRVPDRGAGSATNQPVEVVLARGATITGTVLRNGEEWSGRLGLGRPGTSGGRPVSALNGRYAISGLEPGLVRVFVESEVTGEVVAETTLDVRVEESYERDLSWTEDVGTVAGRVVDAHGDPVSGVLIHVRRPGPKGSLHVRAKTDPDGWFEAEVPLGGTFVVRATDRVVHTEARDVPAGARDLRLVLGASGALTVRLVDAASGDPIDPRSLRFLAWAPAEGGPFRSIKAKATDAGLATIELPAGRIDLEVDLSSLRYVPVVVRDVVVGRSEPLAVELERGFELRLRFSPRDMHALRRHAVFLVDHDRPLAFSTSPVGDDAFVQVDRFPLWVHRSLARQRRIMTHGGSTSLQGLEPGLYELRWFPDDVVLEPSSILLGSGNLSIDVSVIAR